MARRKKLNKRVVLLLAVLGAAVLGLGLAVVFKTGLPDWLFPKDPVALRKKAEAAFEAKHYQTADESFRKAVQAARTGELPDLPAYYLAYAEFCHDWARALDSGLNRAEQLERWRAAVEALRKALRHDPKYVDAQRYLCEMFWEVVPKWGILGGGGPRLRDVHIQNLQEFLKESDKLVAMAPDDPEAHFRRAFAKAVLTQGAEGDMAKEALADFEKTVELKPDRHDYWLAYVTFLGTVEGRAEQVEQVFRRAVQANPRHPSLLIAYADYLRRQGNLVAAEERIGEAIDVNPTLGYIALADHYQRLNKPDDALRVLEKAKQADPLDPRPYLSQARILASRDQSTEAAKVLRAALAALDRAAATQPATQPRERAVRRASRLRLYDLLANVLLDLVEARHTDREKLLTEVRDYREKLQKLGLNAPRLSKIDGRLALADGNYNEALRRLEDAYQGFGAGFDVKTANLLINLYLLRNLPGKAEAILDRLRKDPRQRRNVSVLMAKARLLMRYRDYEKAYRFVTRVLQLDPNQPDALRSKLVLSAMRGETPAFPKQDIPLDGTSIRLLLGRAATMWLDGQRDEAVQLVEELHKRARKNRRVIARLSNLYRAANRMQEAEAVLKKGLEYYPDDKALRSRLELLREKDPSKQRQILLKVADELPPLQRALEKANIEDTFGRHRESLAYLQEAVRVDPNAPGVVERLFRRALGGRDWKLAEQCIERARVANLDGVGGRMYQVRLGMVREQSDTVIATALGILKDRPDRKDARAALGQAYLQKKQYDRAYEAFKTVESNDPGYPPALIGLAAVTWAQGKNPEHADYVERAYRLVPQDPFIRERYFQLRTESARPEELIVERVRALRRRPGDLRNIAGLAALLEQVGRFDRAEEMYVLLHQRSPNKLVSGRILGAFYLRTGKLDDLDRVMTGLLNTWKDRAGVLVVYGEFLSQTDPESAERTFRKAIGEYPDDPRGYVGMAHFQAMRRNWPEAVKFMKSYLKDRPGDPAGKDELIRYLIESRNYAEATRELDKILADDPTHASALTLKGAVAARQGRMAEALEDFTEAVRANPNYDEPLVMRARLHLARGEPSKARTDLEAAKRLSNRSDTSYQLAIVYEALREFDSAERVYREVLRKDKRYVPALNRLLSSYHRRQKWNDLEKLLAQAKQTFPTSPLYWMREAEMWDVRGNTVRKIQTLAQAVQVAPEAVPPLREYLLALQKAGKHKRILETTEKYLTQPQFATWVPAVRAAALVRSDRSAEADRLFLQAIAVAGPDEIPLIVQQVRNAYELAGGTQKLMDWLKQRPDDCQLHLMLAALYSEAQELPKGVATLQGAEKLTKTDTQRFLLYRLLGAFQYRLGRFPQAEQAYLTCLKYHRGSDVRVLNNLAYLYTNDLDQPQKGLPYAVQAVRRMPNNARVLDTLGWTLARTGRLVEAEQQLMRAIQLDNSLAASRYHLGWVYEKSERFDEALKQYRQGYEMVRTDEDERLRSGLQAGLDRVRQKLKAGSVP
jgi:tetratricopeptide (TPR) repeat protein